MEPLLLLSSRLELAERISEILTRRHGKEPDLVRLPNNQTALDHLSLEMPEMFLLDFSSPDLDAWALLDSIQTDSWLMQGGIVGICDDQATLRRLIALKGANLVVSLLLPQLEGYLAKVLEIIQNNRRILHQWDLSNTLVRGISGSFRLDNDLISTACYANLIGNFLYSSNCIDLEQKGALTMILTEMLVNAVEHGNCGISYDEKSAWLENGGVIQELVEERCRDGAISRRTVLFEFNLGPDRARFLVADEGKGFDWRTRLARLKDGANLMDLHGRGISITRQWTQNLRYNDRGNEAQFEVVYQNTGTSLTPGPFQNLQCHEFKPGDIVFREDEPSDSLFYIVKGTFEVLASSGGVISRLSPDDMFVGEMSFLLDNRRSATVRARTDGRLIRISKREFIEAVKRKPYYALMLCRLLARRITRLNAAFQVHTGPGDQPSGAPGEARNLKPGT